LSSALSTKKKQFIPSSLPAVSLGADGFLQLRLNRLELGVTSGFATSTVVNLSFDFFESRAVEIVRLLFPPFAPDFVFRDLEKDGVTIGSVEHLTSCP